MFRIFFLSSFFASRWREENPKNHVFLEPFFEIKDEFFRFFEMSLQFFGNQIEVSASFDEIEEED